MTGLGGDFTTMPLQELVVYLGTRGASGILHFECETVHKTVALRQGAVVNAGSSEPREFLGQFLINMGHLTEEQLERAFQVQRSTRVLLGKVLVHAGLVPEPQVRTALDLKFRETLLEAFRWREGTFRFTPGATPPPLEGLDVAVDLLDLQREAEFRDTAWEAIRAVFPSGQLRLTAAPSRLPAPLAAGSLDARILEMVHEGLTIDDMLVALRSTDFHLYQRLYALYRQEVVRPLEEAGARAPARPSRQTVLGTESQASEVRAHARAFLAAGNTRDAEVLARQAHELEPCAEGEELLREAEAALYAELRTALLEPPRVPVLAIPPAQLRSSALGSAERYLLSRVDGQRDVATIVRVAPVRELDALRHFQDFEARGLIHLARPQPAAGPAAALEGGDFL